MVFARVDIFNDMGVQTDDVVNGNVGNHEGVDDNDGGVDDDDDDGSVDDNDNDDNDDDCSRVKVAGRQLLCDAVEWKSQNCKIHQFCS